MMRHSNLALALMLAALLTGVAQGDFLLYQSVVNIDRGINDFDTDQFDLDLILGDDFFDPNNPVILFDSLVISPADVGTTYNATAASDPNNFAAAAALLTDGINEFISTALTEDQLGGSVEQRGGNEDAFFSQPTPPGPPDLFGSSVDRVSLHIDAFVFVSSSFGGGAAPLTEGQPFDVDITVSFFSEVPEPTAARLLLFGLLAMSVIAYRRQRRTPSIAGC
jgi:hypothetical protein